MKKSLPALTLAALMLTGCAGRKASSPSAADTPSGSAVTGASAESGEKKEDIVLTLALAGNPEDSFFQTVDSFNAADNGYRVEIKRCGEDTVGEDGLPQVYTEEEYSRMDMKLIQEIMNTDDIDIAGSISFCDPAKFGILKQKGAFADLNLFMEADAEVNRSTLNEHILDLCSDNGRLYEIPQYYWAETLIGKSEYVGTKQNWSVDELLEHWASAPENTTLFGCRNAENIYYNLLRSNLEAFVDEDSAKVHFDSPDFRKLLEFCGSFPSNNGEKGELDYNAPMFLTQYWIRDIRSGIFAEHTPGKITSDGYMEDTTPYRLREGGYTLVGYPSSDGSGAFLTGDSGFAVCANSSKEKQRGAWEFIRQFYTEEYQLDNSVTKYEYSDPAAGQNYVSYSMPEGFCINNGARKKLNENILSGAYNSNAPLTVGGKPVIDSGEAITADEEDVRFIEDYIASIDRWETDIDRDLWGIIEDEVITCLGGGQDIDRTIDMIQNRASIWVSEQY